MPRGSEARAWWADVEDVRERIEHRRASEQLAAEPEFARADSERSPHVRLHQARLDASGYADDWFAPRRTVSITGQPASGMGAARLRLVQSAPTADEARAVSQYRRRPRQNVVERMGSRPDRVAGLAVMLGFLLVVAAMLSARG